MPTNTMENWDDIAYSGQDFGLTVGMFPGYPRIFTYEGRTKYILAHPHGIEHNANEAGPLSVVPGVVEPGTLLFWKDETELDRGGNSVTKKNLYPFTCAIPYGGAAADGDEFTITFDDGGTTDADELACNRFIVGQHVWAVPRDFSDDPEDLGEVLSIDEDNNTINVENDITVTTDTDCWVYVAEEDANGTFPTIVGVSMFFCGPETQGSVTQKGSCVYLQHANVMRRYITHYANVLNSRAYSTTIYPEGDLIAKKLREDVPLLRLMW